MSEIHILFPTPVYQNIFNPIFSLESAIDFIRTLEFKQDYNVYDKPNGKNEKLAGTVTKTSVDKEKRVGTMGDEWRQ